MRSFQILGAVFIAFTTFAAATPNMAGANPPFRRELLPRQTPTAGVGDAITGDATPKSTTTQPSETGSSNKGSNKSSSNKSSSTKKTTKVPATALAGGVSMVTPAPTDGYQIYKIGDIVTFVWNYTNVIIQPTAINVVAYCQDASQDFTISANASWPITSATWDTGEYQNTATAKLLVATYTLNIFDASKQKTAGPTAGYLYGYSQYQFGLYTPQPYTPLADFVCPTCANDANAMDPMAFRMVLAMGLVAATSFTWFLTGRRMA
ncbi:hypothetical protein FN846DRAFT_943534 [Sphaerosporella brunnea]|uniref:DUF7137 domain-containing protein n=1 Tax=Sphaerosporella brunnea TaxID=1250544 RepID=A0A5J5F016_9PEZI|nr:hypothetical protein FN846DRAFT_943534 [Sphaerosporella brunnea]